MEDQPVIQGNARIAQTAPVSLDALLGPRRMSGSGQKCDATMTERYQMLSDGTGSRQIIGFHIHELTAKGSPMPQQDRGDALLEQVIINRR